MKKKTSTGLRIIIIYSMVQIVLPVLFGVVSPSLFATPNESLRAGLYFTVLVSSIGALLMVTINAREHWTPAIELTEPPRASTGANILWGVVGFIGAIILQILVANIYILIYGEQPVSANTEMLLDTATNFRWLLIAIVLLAPVMEELVFRKAVVSLLVASRIPMIVAVVVSSLIFAMVHFDGNILLYSTLGLWFSFLYARTKNLATPMIAHGLMNAFAALPIIFPQMMEGL